MKGELGSLRLQESEVTNANFSRSRHFPRIRCHAVGKKYRTYNNLMGSLSCGRIVFTGKSLIHDDNVLLYKELLKPVKDDNIEAWNMLMTETNLVLRAPTAQEFIVLREAVGWYVPDLDDAEAAIKHSLFSVCIEIDNQCIGTGRVVGDGFLVFHVQDVIVLPEHQRKGYGTTIMNAIMKYINSNAKPTAFIALFSARGLESWYNRFGFIERPFKNFGPGMAFFKA